VRRLAGQYLGSLSSGALPKEVRPKTEPPPVPANINRRLLNLPPMVNVKGDAPECVREDS
jgi:hypothetical protein